MSEIARTRLFDLNKERSRIIDIVKDRVMSGRVQAAWESREHGLEYVLNEAAYAEMSRLERSAKKRHQEQFTFWQDLAAKVGRASEEENADHLEQLVVRYASDIVGQFNPTVFRLATKALPVALNLLFSAQGAQGAQSVRGLRNLFRQLNRLSDRVLIRGELDRLRKLSELGTLVLVPTHSSHMDSPLIGWALDHADLPPVTYGAGKNMFKRPLTAFFLRNLGAYKVDRRLQFSLYKDVLKTVSQIFIEQGFHSLFFPGGTRSRAGSVEQHLKLGLVSTALSAYIQSQIDGRPQRVFVVPVTINYHLVLEAETLIGDYLRADGQSRFIIDDDEFSDLGRVTRYAMNTMGMDNPLCLYLCPPMDPFGNEVDETGQSYDQRGRPVDPARYVMTDLGPAYDDARDREYIRWLGNRIAESFTRHNMVFSVHLVSLALLHLVAKRHPRWDLYNMIRFGKGEVVARHDLLQCCDRLLALIRKDAAEGRVLLGPLVERAEVGSLVDEACRYFSMYHASPLVNHRGEDIELANLPLLYFYSNRARGYDLERRLAEQRDDRPHAGPSGA